MKAQTFTLQACTYDADNPKAGWAITVEDKDSWGTMELCISATQAVVMAATILHVSRECCASTTEQYVSKVISDIDSEQVVKGRVGIKIESEDE